MTRQQLYTKNKTRLTFVAKLILLFILYTYPLWVVRNLAASDYYFILFWRNYWLVCSLISFTWSISEREVRRFSRGEGRYEEFPGFVYVMKRDDGIYKIGRTIDTSKRLKAHKADYGKNFELIKKFTVPNARHFETKALALTREYMYLEDGRRELREMDDLELEIFLAEFMTICVEAIDK
jgi:predicted GIY-YIG superfamily endonuclease